ncbi:hypothetical protein [Ulvibacter litoralis]|uniref:hypothetical protein n=1 Tax=Ulvibacter litoralis TaxID=227084 RepID=UPI0011130302|nr:hypothetical protein [Ulvibacter litoralis]
MLLAVLYVVAPLKNVFLGGLHEIEHAFTQTSAAHSHQLAHDHDEEHEHEHRIVSFFATLFSSESNASDSDKVILNVEFDKHIVQQTKSLQLPLKPFRIDTYFYVPEVYTASFRNTTPPPEPHFS